ncbi:MAG: ABC transporter ATP-binding protein, partial [Acidimicrobiia bacterium]
MSRPSGISTVRLAWEMMKYRPVLFVVSAVLWAIVHLSPIALGLLIGLVFNTLAGETPAADSPWTPVAVFAAVAIGRNAFIYAGDIAWINYFFDQALQLRRNLLGWLLEAPGSRVLPSSPGEALSTFRDDVDDLLEYVENYVDLAG